MADVKISELTAALTVGDSDVIPMTASGSTVKASASLLKQYYIGTTDIQFPMYMADILNSYCPDHLLLQMQTALLYRKVRLYTAQKALTTKKH